jgi:TonB-dependent starch-binding outer membrane protein SusC
MTFHLRQGLLCLFLLFSAALMAQRTITGTVTDATSSEPLIGASVIVVTEPGLPARGVITDDNGVFSLRVEPTDTEFKVSFIGYTAQTQVIVAGQNLFNVALVSGSVLEEMVVIGYGEVKRDDLTGSVVSVTSKDFQRGNVQTAEQLLMGKSPGVSIISTSGAPGAGVQIRIRGGSSLNASNDPLIVLDGVPLDLGEVKGAANPLSFLNPNDIESFTILKDASASAIYGSRASNGVIIITTKKGAAGKKMSISFSSLLSYATPTKFVELLDTAQFRQAVRDHGPIAAQNMTGTAETDWQREIIRNAISLDNSLSIYGGGKTLPYRLSLGNLRQQGLLLNSAMDRYSVGVGLTPSFDEGRLRFDINAKGAYTLNNFVNGGAVGSALQFDPTMPVYQEDGVYNGYYEWTDNSGKPNVLAPKNPVGLLNQKRDVSNVYRSVGNIATDYRMPFLKELRANLNLGYDISQSDGNTQIDSTTAEGFGSKGQDNYYDQSKQNLLLDFYLNYAKDMKFLKSRIDLTAGYSYQDFIRRDSTFNSSQTGVVSQELMYKTQNTLVSVFSRLNYDVNNRYLLTLTVRQDGSSRFSPENRWGTFPSAALAWKIKNENFLAGSRVISDLKFRVGWGVTGQQGVTNDYPYLPRFTFSESTANYPFGSTYYTTFRPEGYDSNIKWEETETQNIGLDFGFAKNRILGSVDVYQRTTSDLLATIPVPAGSNLTNQILTNVGSLENKGIELSLNTIPVRTQKLEWTLGVNISYNQNKITKLLQVTDPNFVGIASGGISGGVGNNIQMNSVGYARGVFFVLQQYYDETGKPIEGEYIDTNGDGQSTLDDRIRVGQADPVVVAGLSTSLTYGKWSLSGVARGNFGQTVYNNVSSDRGAYQNIYGSTKVWSNLHASVLETGFDKNQFFSDYYLEKADFVRIDNIVLGYNTKLSGKYGLGVNFIVNNAWVFTNYSGIDPEFSNGIDNNIFPRPRTYSLGLNLNF